MLETVQEALIRVVQGLRVAVEAVGALWIAVGSSYVVEQLVKAHLLGKTTSFSETRLTCGRYRSLALEFQLASDILSTSIAPSWQEIGRLAATAVIRTALN